MFELLKTFQKNAATFYDFSTGARQPLWPSYLAKLVIAIGASCLSQKLDVAFLGAILTVFGILIGFSFNVLIFLLSFGKAEIRGEATLEAGARIDRLQKIADELFWNVSYFNLSAIALVIVTTMSFVSFWRGDAPALVGKLIIFILIIECLHTFLRTVARITFYFSLRQRV